MTLVLGGAHRTSLSGTVPVLGPPRRATGDSDKGMVTIQVPMPLAAAGVGRGPGARRGRRGP